MSGPGSAPGTAETRAHVRRWFAWAPGLEGAPAWEAWSRAPAPLGTEGRPDAGFLPPMLRRRCTPLTRLVLTAAFGALAEEERPRVRTVFATRHGSINESIELLHQVVAGERLSPTKFSHTVHNAQAGLFSLAAQNRAASCSLAGRDDTFACGWLEVLAHLERDPSCPVLYVMADVELAPRFAALVEEPEASYALALLVARDGEGTPLRFDLGGGEATPVTPWPHAGVFLRWFLSDAERLSIGRFHWTRGSNGPRSVLE
jgi:Beta-ketoacyl synthase, N-terminal domain